MSIQAVSWVLQQSGEDLPGTARLVMIALANHADHTSGHCWPSIETIAKESGCGERTVSRYIAALVRNGFIEKQQTMKNGGNFRSNDYWLLFDRPSAKWDFFEGKEEPAEPLSTLVSEEASAILADDRPPRDGGRYIEEPSTSEPLVETDPTEAVRPIRAAAAAVTKAPKNFSKTKRDTELDKLKAAEEARKAQPIPVIQGSAPWQAWVAKGHPSDLTCKISVNGRIDRGWCFPSLYPPRENSG
jgi:GntR family transcriptional regulator